MQLFSLHSIRGRLTLASLILLPLICGLLAWSLDKAYSNSLMAAQQRQMTLQAFALMAAAEIEGAKLWLPEQMTDDRLNQISSDTFALVLAKSERKASVGETANKGGSIVLWRSLSASDKVASLDWPSISLDPGQADFSSQTIGAEAYFILRYAVEWETEEGRVLNFQFMVAENRNTTNEQLSEYRNTLWLWLGVIGFSLILLQLLILRWGLYPIKGLVEDLSAVQRGKEGSLSGPYPAELSVMTDSINQLIDHEAKQRERYRNTLANLAHSIKNPAAIIASAVASAKQHNDSEQPWIDDIEEQNQRINQVVSYQLTRAVGGSAAPFNKAILLKPLCEKIVSALKKVYADKAMQLSLELTEDAAFRGDEGDLMELLGNLIDNAFKYGRHRIHITSTGDTSSLMICIEDGGPGMTVHEKTQLVQRGERADTALPGQGIGLAVVTDIVASYGGEMMLKDAPDGGLSVSLSFSW